MKLSTYLCLVLRLRLHGCLHSPIHIMVWCLAKHRDNFNFSCFHFVGAISRGRRNCQSVQQLGYGLDNRGLIPGRVNSSTFSWPPPPHRLWATPNLLSSGYRVKRPRREPDQSPPSRAEVKNAWSYSCTPPYVFMTWCLVKPRDNLTFSIVLWMKWAGLVSREVKHAYSVLYSHPYGKRRVGRLRLR